MENINNMIIAAKNNNIADFKLNFEKELMTRIDNSLEIKRMETAEKLFNTEPKKD